MAKQKINVSLDEEVLEAVSSMATKEDRTTSNMINWLLKRVLDDGRKIICYNEKSETLRQEDLQKEACL